MTTTTGRNPRTGGKRYENLKLKAYLRTLSRAKRGGSREFAERCNTSLRYLHMVSGGFNFPSADFMLRIERESHGLVPISSWFESRDPAPDPGTVRPWLRRGGRQLPADADNHTTAQESSEQNSQAPV